MVISFEAHVMLIVFPNENNYIFCNVLTIYSTCCSSNKKKHSRNDLYCMFNETTVMHIIFLYLITALHIFSLKIAQRDMINKNPLWYFLCIQTPIMNETKWCNRKRCDATIHKKAISNSTNRNYICNTSPRVHPCWKVEQEYAGCHFRQNLPDDFRLCGDYRFEIQHGTWWKLKELN